MAETIDLINEIGAKTALLDAAIKQLGIRGKEYARAEMNYKVSLAKKILEQRDKGIAVTIISDICRGDPEIARLRFERDCAEVMYRSATEAINNYKLQIRILDNQISREWSNV